MSEQIIFYILAAIIVVFSMMTVTTRSILRAATYLLFVLIATSGLYFLIAYNFMAAVQLTVYAGGIVVLIVFSILLTARLHDKMDAPSTTRSLAAGILTSLGAILTIYQITNYKFTAVPTDNPQDTVKEIGTALLSYGEGGFVLPFEVISVLLLAAMVGAIVIAKRPAAKTKLD